MRSGRPGSSRRFSDEAIRAIVAKARYSEPAAAAYISDTLIKRRDKVLKAWLTGVNPIVEPRLSAGGTLTFENAAVGAGVATAPTAYVLTWSKFDNATGTNVGQTQEVRVESTAWRGAAVDRAGRRVRVGRDSKPAPGLSRLGSPRERLFPEGG